MNDVDDENQWVRRTCDEILDYVAAHPLAADSINGVLSFWVRSNVHRGSRVIVERSLDLLTEMGRITQETLPGGQILYRGTRSEDRG